MTFHWTDRTWTFNHDWNDIDINWFDNATDIRLHRRNSMDYLSWANSLEDQRKSSKPLKWTMRCAVDSSSTKPVASASTRQLTMITVMNGVTVSRVWIVSRTSVKYWLPGHHNHYVFWFEVEILMDLNSLTVRSMRIRNHYILEQRIHYHRRLIINTNLWNSLMNQTIITKMERLGFTNSLILI